MHRQTLILGVNLGNRSSTPPLKLATISKLQENGAYEIRLHQTYATS